MTGRRTQLLGARARWRVIEDDTLKRLPQLPDGSVDAVVCDPPYGISFDNQEWDGRAIHHAVTHHDQPRLSDGQAFERWTTMWGGELARILKPGGHLLAFAAPRMSHRLTTGLEDAGLEIRDVLMWLYGQGMPKSRRLPGGRGTALKPAYEPIILARRPLEAALERNLKRHGTGALSIDACRIAPPNQPHVARARRTRPCDAVDEGRWPANVILTHAAGCRPARCASACPAGGLDRHAPSPQHGGAGASRFFYCAKASRRERDAGCDALPARNLDLFPNALRRSSRPRAVRNAHPTVKPIEVMRWLVRLACPPDGLVLDPFCGSGSTGIATILEGRRFLGIELDPEHAQLARTRITHWATTPPTDS